MNTRQRILMGALGGITPYLVTLLSIDFKTTVAGYEALDWIGLCLRCVILIFLGALVAYLHKTESEPFKLFQLGLAAPALLATFINGNAGTSQTLPTQVSAGIESISVVSPAYASDTPFLNSPYLREPQVNNLSRFLRGVLGTKLETSTDNAYFVVVGSYPSKEIAEKQIAHLATKAYKGVLYNLNNSETCFSVVIASNVSNEEARRVRDMAIKDGLPADTHIWKY